MMDLSRIVEQSHKDQVRRDCIASLYEFVKHAWPTVDPRPFVETWHIYVMCVYLEKFSRGEIPNLIINIPPGHAKSLVASVMFPAWMWLQEKTHPGVPGDSSKFLCESHSANLTIRDSLRCRELIRSEWYQTTFKPRWHIVKDQEKYYTTSNHGWRFSVGVDGDATGWRPNFRITDDPLDASAISSSAKREACIEWNDMKMSSRLQDLERGHLLIMQRLHENDLVGHILRTRGDMYELLCLQAEYDPTSLASNANNLFNDPRTPGELLFPAVYDSKKIGLLKRILGSFGTASQLQQSPVSREGGFFKHHWLRRYQAVEIHPQDFVEVIQSWDCAVEGEVKNDRVSGQIWGRVRDSHPKYPGCFVLYDSVCENADFVKNLHMIKAFSLKHPYAQDKLIEKKANGAPIIQLLKNELHDSHVIPFDPQSRSKEVRASAVSPVIESGQVIIPEDSAHDWVSQYVEELTMFPRGKHDDQVDATTQALLHFTQGSQWVFSF